MKNLLLASLLIVFIGCSQKNTISPIPKKPTSAAWRVIQTGDKMINTGVLVRGSCWDYIDCIYTKSGCKRSKRLTVFKSKKRGPYANIGCIKAGDWLYFINGAYHNSEHSAIFIKWINYEKKVAKMLSYQGEGKRKPARYKNYTLNKVYNIMRAQ